MLQVVTDDASNLMSAGKRKRIEKMDKKVEIKEVMEIALGDKTCWLSIKYCLEDVVPIVKVLRLLVDRDSKQAMLYICEVMDRAKANW